MKSNRWVLLTFTAIACAGETGIAPPPAQLAAPPELQSPARIEATRQSLKQGEAGLQAYLNAVERGRPGYSVDPEALRRNRRDVADVRAALSLIRRNLDSLHGPSATVLLGDGTPVYADTTNMHWVDAGTWLKLYADVSGATFTASSQYSQPVLLHTAIRGNTSTGWQGSSDDGFSATATVLAISDAARPLSVPTARRDCNASKVTTWGTSEHTAKYAISANFGLTGATIQYQPDSRGNASQFHVCVHTPLTADVVTSGDLVVGGTGSAGVIWHGSQSSTVTDCPTSWSASPAGIVSLGQGSGSPAPDSRSISAVSEGTATITASCRGVSGSASFTVLPASPPPACGDPTASNYGARAACTFPPAGTTTGTGAPPPPAYSPPPPTLTQYCYTWVEIINEFDADGNVSLTTYFTHYECYWVST